MKEREGERGRRERKGGGKERSGLSFSYTVPSRIIGTLVKEDLKSYKKNSLYQLLILILY